jgi:putative membrane protein
LTGEIRTPAPTDYLANERTYLAWIRTGITVIALGFVVAKFGIIIRELVPNAPSTSYHLSSEIGIVLVIIGGGMQLLALRSFFRNKRNIDMGKYIPSTIPEALAGVLAVVIAILVVVYMVITL